MDVKELKDYLKDLPDSMPIGILDTTTDDELDMNYPINNETLYQGEYVNADGELQEGQMLFFTFENSLNNNPI